MMSTSNKIKQVIAIASGKGGVGKSTIATNLSLALKQVGYAVGLLDADLYGPSLPVLLGIPNDTVVQHDADKNMQPVMAYGMPTMSIGYLVDERAPAIWRGPIASKAIQQLFYNTQWGALDYLMVDLPPGTGDIHLTLAQKLPLQGAIIVSTPQKLSLADVRKAMAMFQKVNIPLLGIIENMSVYQCAHCGETTHLFGQGGSIILAQEYDTTILGHLPFDVQICDQSDQGKPLVISQPDSPTSRIYHEISQKLLNTTQQKRVRSFPKIVVEA
jgi:ATP-binding protein involved in chromosome partitioning